MNKWMKKNGYGYIIEVTSYFASRENLFWNFEFFFWSRMLKSVATEFVKATKFVANKS